LPPLPAKGETPQTIRVRRDSSVKRGGRAPSVGPRSGTPVPTMSGFYFHQNSEPCVSQFAILCHCFTDGNDHRYQQLSLNHVPECTSSSFEFRWDFRVEHVALFSHWFCLFACSARLPPVLSPPHFCTSCSRILYSFVCHSIKRLLSLSRCMTPATGNYLWYR
jgi:hypothetical protein